VAARSTPWRSGPAGPRCRDHHVEEQVFQSRPRIADLGIGVAMPLEHGTNLLASCRGEAGGPDLRDVRHPQQIVHAAQFLEFALMKHGDAIADIFHVGQ